MPRGILLSNLSYDEYEELLLQRVHAYRRVQIAYGASGYHKSFMLTLQDSWKFIDKCLGLMGNIGEPESLEQLVRNYRRLEHEFYQECFTLTNKNYLIYNKYTQLAREAIDGKLDELGMPVLKPEDYN